MQLASQVFDLASSACVLAEFASSVFLLLIPFVLVSVLVILRFVRLLFLLLRPFLLLKFQFRKVYFCGNEFI